MASPAGVLSILVRADTRGAQAGLIRLNQRLTTTGAAASQATATIAQVGKIGALGAAVGLAYAVKSAASFEEQMSSLGSVTQANNRQMKAFAAQAKKAGADTKFSALEAAEAQTELAKGGISVRNILKGGLNSALALAAAGELDLGDAAATTANAMNLFGLRGKQSKKVADALATAANATTADVSDFAMALQQGGSIAKTAGVSFSDTVVVLEALAKSGIKNSDAGTSLKTAYLQLIAPTKKQAELAKQLNLSFVDQHGNLREASDLSERLRKATEGMGNAERAANFKVLAGTDGVRTLNALYAAGPEKIDKWKDGLEESGTAAEVAREKHHNFAGAMENLRGTIETLSISAGEKLIPSLTKITRGINKVLNDPNLTNQQKLDKFAQMFVDAIKDVTPDVLEAAKDAGLIAARGFFKGFTEAPLWGKLLIAAFVGKKLGLFNTLKKTGSEAGNTLGQAAGVAATQSTVAHLQPDTLAKNATTALKHAGTTGGTVFGESIAHGATQSIGGAMSGGRFAENVTDTMRKTGRQAGAVLGTSTVQTSVARMQEGIRTANDTVTGQTAWVGYGTKAGEAAGQAAGKALPPTLLQRAKNFAPGFQAFGKATIWGSIAAGVLAGATSDGGFKKRLQMAFSVGTFGLFPAPKEISERIQIIASKIQSFKDSGKLKLSDPNDPDRSLIRKKDLDDFSSAEKKMLMGMARLRNFANQNFGKGAHMVDEAWARPDRAIRQLNRLQDSFGRMSKGSVVKLNELRNSTERNSKIIAETLGTQSKKGRNALQTNFTLGFKTVKEMMASGTLNTRQGSREIARLLRQNSKVGKDQLAQNFKLARDAIAAQMGGAVKITDKNAGAIRRIFAQELSNYGFTKAEIKNRLSGKEFSGKTIGGSDQGVYVNKQRGGMVVPGTGTGDKVGLAINGVMAAKVEPQEGVFVLNRKAMGAMQAINDKYPRFAGGGIVALGHRLQRMGYAVGENPAFGGVHPVHVPNSYHYRGMALDVNWPGPDEPTKLDQLYSRLKGMRGVVELLWRVAGHFDHLHVAMSGPGGGGLLSPARIKRILVGGPESPLRDMIQGATDHIRAAAQKQLDSLTGSMEGVESGVIGGSARQNMRIGRRLASRFGWGAGSQWASLVELWNRESGWNAMARNPSSGAFGIPQALPPTKMPAAAQRGDAASQIMWGLQYIAGRYGSPSGALAWHNAHNWYQRGGMIPGLLYGGGADTRQNPYGPLRGSELFRRSPFGAPFQPYKTTPGGDLTRLLRTMRRRGIKPRIRRRELRRFLKKLKGLGLSDRMSKDIKRLTDDADKYGEYSTRAADRNVTKDDGSEVLGTAYGKTEQQWLTDQLDALFKLRNRLIEAAEMLKRKREAVMKLLDRARQRLRTVNEALGAGGHARNKLEKRLKELRKKPKQNKEAIKATKKQLDALDSQQRVRSREKSALKSQIIPGLLGQVRGEGSLQDSRRTVLDQLDDVQGKYSPKTILRSLPGIDVLGGQIYNVRNRLLELGQTKQSATDPAGGETLETIKELNRRLALRADISDTALRTLQFAKTDPFLQAAGLPFAGSFGGGGLVNAPLGQPVTAILHGQETVSPPGGPNIQVILGPGMEWLDKYIEVKVDGITRKQANPARAPLPGRTGGLQR